MNTMQHDLLKMTLRNNLADMLEDFPGLSDRAASQIIKNTVDVFSLTLEESTPEPYPNSYMQELICRVAPRWAWDMIDNPENTEADVWPAALLAMQIACEKADDEPLTRADLYQFDEWEDVEKDTSGNPCVWLNSYVDSIGRTWLQKWSCQCEDDGFDPITSVWVGPEDHAHRTLWEMLPEKE